jgi:hypothetical protein
MRKEITENKLDIINNQRINTLVKGESTSGDLSVGNRLLREFFAENCENFATYLKLLGLEKDTDFVILSSHHHYYYDAEEMINVKNVINLKELNQIKQLKELLHSVFHILSPNCKFIGCFVNNKKQNNFVLYSDPSDHYHKRNSDAIEYGIASRSPFLNMIYNMIDSKTNKYLSERSVYLLLEEHGFKIVNMTELDGLTYFCAQRLRTAEN